MHVTIDSSRGGGIRGGVHAHARPIREADIVVIDGLRVTSPARTAVDLAMAGDHGQALSIVDSARLTVRFPNADTRPPVTVDQLEESAEVLGWRPGLPMFRRAMAESVQDSGSAGESRTRAMLLEWNLPIPQLQTHYRLGGRNYYADFSLPGMIGEFDGMAKYADDPDRKQYEIQRAGDFRSAGIAVVNWYWEDLKDRHRIFKILTNEMVRCDVLRRVPVFPG